MVASRCCQPLHARSRPLKSGGNGQDGAPAARKSPRGAEYSSPTLVLSPARQPCTSAEVHRSGVHLIEFASKAHAAVLQAARAGDSRCAAGELVISPTAGKRTACGRQDSQSMVYHRFMRTKTIALTAAAVAFAGLGLAVSAQQKPAASKSGANTIVVYKSPT